MSLFAPPARSEIGKKLLWAIFTCAVIGVALFHSRSWFLDSSPKRDFDSYYCGAKVVLNGHDPYLVEPLRTCEVSLGGSIKPTSAEMSSFFVRPTPLPGYVLAFFEPLAEFPYKVARILFGLSCLAAGIIMAFCLSKISPVPFLPAIGICYFAINFDPMGNNGAMACISICLIAIAALLARDGRISLAIVALGAAMIQPHIAAFSMIVAFLFFPKHRLVVVVVGTVLCAISLAALGIKANVEYLELLPLHAAAETLSPFQRSFAGLLAAIGVKPSLALACGTAWSVAMLLTAIFVLKNMISGIRDVSIRNASIVIVPTAFAAFGGTFIHETQMDVVILPAFLLLRPQGRFWMIPALALGMLVLPIEDIGSTHRGFPLISVFFLSLVCAWLFIYYLSITQRARFYANVTAPVLAAMLLLAVLSKPVFVEASAVGMSIQGSELASTAWTLYEKLSIAANNSTVHDKLWHLFMRLSLWFSVCVVIICTVMRGMPLRSNACTDSDLRESQPSYILAGAEDL